MTKVTPTALAKLKLPGGEVDIPGKILSSGVQQFLGVPYAEPVEGETVFDAPQQLQMIKPEQAAGTREMDAPVVAMPSLCYLCCSGCRCCLVCNHCCCRARSENGNPKGKGLDVLRMNIWRPPVAKDEAKAPVMVWIHGGGDSGSAAMADPNSRNGSRLSAAGGVVVCVVEFRQGIFGTMDWGNLSGIPTNIELRDMLCALKWIQNHIESFGGNPRSVTIFGESIGGRRVTELVYCKAAAGLFHAAIASSPSAPEMCNLSEAHRAYRRALVLRYLGMDEKDVGKSSLAKIPRQKLLNAQTAAKGGFVPLPGTKLSGASEQDKKDFGSGAHIPSSQLEWARASLGFLNWRMVDGLRTGFFDASVLDGELITAPVGEGGASADVPFLLMFTKDEFSAFGLFPGLKPHGIKTRDQAVERLMNLLPVRGKVAEATLLEIARNYFDDYAKLFADASVSDVYRTIVQDTWQYHAVVAIAKNHASAFPGKTYVASYVYDCGGESPHGCDISSIFALMPSIPVHKKGTDFGGIVSIMQSTIATFARSGKPNSWHVPFAAFDATDPKMTLLDSTKTGGISMPRCEVVATYHDRDSCYEKMLASLREAEH